MKNHILLSIFIASIFYASSFSMNNQQPKTLESFTKKNAVVCCRKETIISGVKDCLETTIRLSESFENEEKPAYGLCGGAFIGAYIVCSAFCKTLKNRVNNHTD